MKSPLRFGVLAAHPSRAWHRTCLERFARLDGIQAVAWVEPAPTQDEAAPWDRFLEGQVRSSQTLAPIAGDELVAHWPKIHKLDDANQLATLELDFVLCFGDPEPARALIDATGHGVWHFRGGPEHQPLDERFGFWESYRGIETTSASLQQLTADPNQARPLFEATLHTRPSFVANADQMLALAALWPELMARRVTLGELDRFAHEPRSVSTQRPARPGRAHLMTLPIRRVQHKTLELWQRCFMPQWNVGLADATLERLVSDSSPLPVTWIDEPKMAFYADPFVLDGTNEKVRLLVEDFDFRTSLGKISEIEVDRDGRVLRCDDAIEREHHLSYPFLLKRDGTICCIPEMGIEARVELFEQNGTAWTKTATLIDDYPALDPTPLYHEGRWWMFCTSWALGEDNNLCALYADQLEGPWTEHPLNPLKADVRSSRPAGPFFQLDGQLYRPAQVGTGNYGGGLSIQKVLKLTPTDYEEVEVNRIEPDPDDAYPSGLHTLVVKDGVVAVDGKRWAFGPLIKLIARIKTGR